MPPLKSKGINNVSLESNIQNTPLMKKILYLLSAALISNVLMAQSKIVILTIDHKIGLDTCAAGIEGVNNLGNQFKINRIQYYMDEIILVHDGATSDTSTVLALVDGFDQTSLNLGSFTLDSIESIRFAIGVNSSLNHLDPTTYNPNHPLAPKSPSMHWGWTAGYRFIAAEGVGGSTFNQIFEFHGLGDGNYAHLTLPTSGQYIGTDTVLITVTANYNELFRGQNLASGPISHGETGGAAQVLHNINNYVFSSSEGNAALGLRELNSNVNLYPNPSFGAFTLEAEESGTYDILDVAGRKVASGVVTEGKNRVNLNLNGLFFLRIQYSNGGTSIHKVYVK